MEKIEVYDMFVKDLGRYYDIEPIAYALDFCRLEALEHKDRDILHLLLSYHRGRDVKAMLERERHGERCIPDYLWKAMGKWIRDLNIDWLRQAKFYERPPKLIDKEMEELKEIKKRLLYLEFHDKEWHKLFARKRELDPELKLCKLGTASHVNEYYFRHEYFRDRAPYYKKQNYKKQVRALNDLSKRHLKFIELFEE